MPRNLDRRIELLVPVDHPDCRKRLLEILQVYFRDNVKARRLQNDGTFSRPEPPDDPSARPLRAQDVLYRRACEAVAEAEKSRLTEFIPHKAPEE
jgi:polyphosphate kinase